MDLGIKGKKAIVCASSKGLGLGCANALADAGVHLLMCARNEKALKESAALIAKKGVKVDIVVCDITTDQGIENVLKKMPNPDILINNAGGPPPGNWKDWTNNDFLEAINANMLTPIKMIKRVLPSMIEKRWGRIINITSGAVKAPIPALGLSNTARAGLTGFVAGVSRQVAKDGVCINNLLPGIHDTDRIKGFDETMAEELNVSVNEIRKKKALTIPAGYYGDAQGFGNTCAFLCSLHAGFIVGQNIVLDGGAINSTI